MNRRSFLTYSCAFVATTVVGSLVQCTGAKSATKSDGDTGARLTANLADELTTVGSSKSQNGVIVVRRADGNTPASFVALTNVCTHKGCKVKYKAEQNQLACPCHGSRFGIDGSVIKGPAKLPLELYRVKVENDILTVS